MEKSWSKIILKGRPGRTVIYLKQILISNYNPLIITIIVLKMISQVSYWNHHFDDVLYIAVMLLNSYEYSYLLFLAHAIIDRL